MTEPDWTDVLAVRAWLDKKYPVANMQIGSPFFQYLKDEKAKGKSLRNRELRLSAGSGGEFFRWIAENYENESFHYSTGLMLDQYYPEYFEPLSESISPVAAAHQRNTIEGLPSLTVLNERLRGIRQDSEESESEQMTLRSRKERQGQERKINNTLPSNDLSLSRRNRSTAKKRPLGSERKPSPKEPPTTESSARQKGTSAKKVNEKVEVIDQNPSKAQKDRISTLRPKRDRKRTPTGM